VTEASSLGEDMGADPRGQKVETSSVVTSSTRIVSTVRNGSPYRQRNERAVVRRLVPHDVVQRLAVREHLARLHGGVELRA
jgi:hypothetical protein